jgi:hypothetical protein
MKRYTHFRSRQFPSPRPNYIELKPQLPSWHHAVQKYQIYVSFKRNRSVCLYFRQQLDFQMYAKSERHSAARAFLYSGLQMS